MVDCYSLFFFFFVFFNVTKSQDKKLLLTSPDTDAVLILFCLFVCLI